MLLRIQRPVLTFVLTVWVTLYSLAQGNNGLTGIGQWRMHLPYNKAISVAETPGKIYCASRYGLFSYDKSSGELERYSRITGLSDFEIASIKYNAAAGVLVIAYENSNIDLLFNDNTIVNMSDIQRSNIVGNKSINDIFFVDRYAYLSCGFGIVVIDLNRKEIKDTYYIGPNGTNIDVNALTTDGTYFYAATNTGIFKAGVNDPSIFNYTAWNKDTTLPHANSRYTSIVYFSNRLFTVESDVSGTRDSVWIYANSAWIGDPNIDDYDVKVITYQGHLMIKISYTIYAYDNNTLQNPRIMDATIFPNTQPMDGFVSADNTFWIADYNNGLIRIAPDGNYSDLTPSGPRSSSVYAMQFSNDELWVASGGIVLAAPAYFNYGAYSFSDNTWKTFDRTNDAIFNNLVHGWDLVCVAVDPTDSKHAFMGSWGSGVLEYRDQGAVQLYNSYNSTLRAVSDSASFYLLAVGGIAYDSNNNLWMANSKTPAPLSMRSPSGEWKSFPIASQFSGNFLSGLIIDDFNQKWMIAKGPLFNGIEVFNENDINNPNDNSFADITNIAGQGNLPSSVVLSLAKDKDGAIWIGTDQGVAVIYNPGSVFSGENYDAQQILIQQEGHTQYLLQTEYVQAIAVDGANRKWFGTASGGVFLMSSDGTQQLAHFTSENSPLLSNNITSIAIDDNSGEVFFGTEKGIVSYRGDATVGGEVCEGHLVFPNPVQHNYTGPIAIKGLVNNADVKITDITGALVYHARANGGEGIWYGTNFRGDRVHTGIYLVYATNDDGTATCVTKLLFFH